MKQAPLSIGEAVIEKDILKMTVFFTGGCTQHSFKLIASKVFLASIPPRGSGIITHHVHGDSCDENTEMELRFSLIPLRNYVRTGPIYFTIGLAGPEDSTDTVRLFYEF